MKHCTGILTLILTLLISIPSFSASPKREFRGAWLHIVGNSTMQEMTQDAIQAWLIGTLDTLQASGCNAVFFQVRPCADAFYPSEIEPWTKYLTGTQGKAPDPFWDPLQFMIDNCHERGMELHAWLNPYRVATSTKDVLDKNHVYHKNRSVFKTYGGQIYFDPAEPFSREHIVKVVSDIVSRYDVDGIHFDDYFYPYPVSGKDFPDNDSFRKYAQSQGFSAKQKGDWRRHNVTMMIEEVGKAVKEIKPWVRFGVSPFGIHRNIGETPDGSRTNGLSGYSQLYADVPLWAEKGYIDYMAPQLYWKIGHKLADYEILINWWNDLASKGHLYIGQSIETFKEPDLQNPKTNQMARKMELVRTLDNVDGNIWWPGWSIADNVDSIRDSLHVFQRDKALIPAYSDIDSEAPESVEAWASNVSGKIRWITNPTDDPMQKPHFYVVYRFCDDEDADISDPSHILMLTRQTSFTPDPAPDGHRYSYIVTAVDRCWNESEPSETIVIK